MRSTTYRRGRLAGVLAAGALISVLPSLLFGNEDQRIVPGGGRGGGHTDPLAFDPGNAAEFERRAAAGLSHVLYAKSPGGATASARRTAAWRPQVETAARGAGLDPDLLEALVFVESAGRPEVIVGDDPEAASGLTQILAETGQNLLGLKVDLEASRALTRRIAAAEQDGRPPAVVDRLRGERRRIDERFDPRKALAATGRYLTIAKKRFGRDDLAIASYHMGIGNLERALRAYADVVERPVREVVDDEDLTYTRLFFDSTPLLHPDAYKVLSGLGDDSATYLWRVLAGREIMRLYRDDADELARLQGLHERKGSAEEVLHPQGDTKVFDSPDELRDANEEEVVGLPDEPSRYHFAIDPQMGELADRVGEEPTLYRALRPEALALLVYLADGVEEVSGETPLTVTSTVRDTTYQEALGRRDREATRGYSLHTTGYAFDILRKYRSRKQALAFEFWLSRLQALNLIAWVREPAAIHVAVSSEAERLTSLLP